MLLALTLRWYNIHRRVTTSQKKAVVTMTNFTNPRLAIRQLFTRYVDFDGLSGRSAYWWSLMGLGMIGGVFYMWMRSRQMAISVTAIFAADVLLLSLLLLTTILLLPVVSLHVRRYRDAGVTPWLLLLTVFLPLVLIYLELGTPLVTGAALGLLMVNFMICAFPSKLPLRF
jgi:uncharacterized membrane protein YhaH (DUF805 family)